MIEIEHPRQITVGEIRGHRPQAGERVLFRTSNSARCWRSGSFVEDFVYISEPAAAYLAAARVGSDGTPARAILRPLGSHHAGQAAPAEAAP